MKYIKTADFDYTESAIFHIKRYANEEKKCSYIRNKSVGFSISYQQNQ